jgi:hypothetical protein
MMMMIMMIMMMIMMIMMITMMIMIIMMIIMMISKSVPIQACRGPEGSRSLRLPEFREHRHVKLARFSAIRNGRLYSQGTSLVLISI